MLISRFLLSLFLILIYGYFILNIFAAQKRKIALNEAIILSFGLGCGFMSLWMFIISALNIKFSIPILIIPILFLMAVYSLNKKKIVLDFNTKDFFVKKADGIKLLFIFFILLGFIYAFCDTVSLPFVRWDSWCQYGLKAKILYLENNEISKIWADYSVNMPNRAYPLLIPLTETYIYIFLGGIYEQFAKASCLLFFYGAIMLFYSLSKHNMPDSHSLIFTFLLSSVPIYVYMASWAYTDIPLVFYSGLGTLYLYESLNKRDEMLFRIGWIFLCLGAWTKLEGFVILSMNFILWVCVGTYRLEEKIEKCKFIFLLFSIINMPWLIFKTINHLPPSDNIYNILILKEASVIFNKLNTVIKFSVNSLFDVQKWNVVWFLCIMLFFLVKKIFRRQFVFLAIIIILYYLSSIGIYLITENRDIEWLLSTSFDRVMLIFCPWIIYLYLKLFYVRP